MFNRCIMIGNLTKDPDLRYTPSGTPVGSFRIAVNTKYKQGSEGKEEVLFIDIVTFGKQAEVCSQYLSKGKSVLVEGRLRESRWESEGQQKSRHEIVATTVRFLGGGKNEQGNGERAAQQQYQGAPPEELTELEPF